MEIILGVMWLALCAAVGFYAESKGRSGPAMFFASIFLSPLIGFVIVLAMKADEKKVAVATGKKRCPDCAEFVQAEANTCRYCRHQFTERENMALAGRKLGSPCGKCGSVDTYTKAKREKTAHWWKTVEVPYVHCRACGAEARKAGAVLTGHASDICKAVTFLASLVLLGVIATSLIVQKVGREKQAWKKACDDVSAKTSFKTQQEKEEFCERTLGLTKP
jgi:predicted membrane metal-binding protein